VSPPAPRMKSLLLRLDGLERLRADAEAAA
jgi:hypothetical protein